MAKYYETGADEFMLLTIIMIKYLLMGTPINVRMVFLIHLNIQERRLM